MAKQHLFKSKVEASMEMERCIRSIEILLETYKQDIVKPDICCAIGKSLMQFIYSLFEIILYYICRELATEDGTEEWPRLKDLPKKGNLVHAPAEVRALAAAIDSIKRGCDKTFVTPEDLETFLAAGSKFIDWAEMMLGDSIGYKAVSYLKSFIQEWFDYFETESRRPFNDYRLSLVYLGDDVDLDEYTDEELDRIYKRHKGNKRESLLPVFILEILKNHSNKNHRLHISDIIYYLDEEYEISKSRGVIERWIHTFLAADDFHLWEGTEQGSGYWYSEADENAKE